MNNSDLLPYSLEAERSVIGSCILSTQALADVMEILKPDDFTEENYPTIYTLLTELYRHDRPIDLVTVTSELEARNMLDRVGGQDFIMGLVTSVTTTANAVYHAEIVREKSVRRKIIAAGEEISKLALNPDKTIDVILETAEKLLFDAGQNRTSNDVMHVRELIGSVFAEIEDRYKNSETTIAGYATGFVDLDALLGGLQPGSLNIIAARPSMGKTALALNIAQFGGDNSSVLIFSIEMPATQIVTRMLAAESGIDLSKLIRGTFDTSGFDALREACSTLAKRNIYIDDSTQLSAIDFLTKCRRFKTKHPDLSLVVVDYLQLMSSGDKRTEGRQQEVSDISRMLKATAREISCPVIALSQLSRAAEQRTDKKPQLADLRDSGAIEQDADTVMMLFREDYYSENENNDLTDSKADLRVAKNRNGGTGVTHLTFKREITRFVNFGEIL